MNLNYKLFFKYILFHSNQIFLKYLNRNDKNLNVYINESNLYFLTLHIKLSSLFYSTQLCEIFAYETFSNTNQVNLNPILESKIPLTNNSIIVYNFHCILFQQRFFIFSLLNNKKNIKNQSLTLNSLNSITELYLNANWLEREVSELHGIFFNNKKDLRNLMLTYGDVSAPLRKSFPSIGVKELFYDTTTDLLINSRISIQF
jgi:NADH:ubiquinone oxidoreductase subunit C